MARNSRNASANGASATATIESAPESAPEIETETSAPETSAPETEVTPESATETAAETAADESASALLDIAAAVEAEEIEKSARVYVDVCPRFPMPNGQLVSVQREQRADGKQGEYLLAAIRPPKDRSQQESAVRVSIALLQKQLDTLAAHSVKVIKLAQ